VVTFGTMQAQHSYIGVVAEISSNLGCYSVLLGKW
jgi:hypothetical protein